MLPGTSSSIHSLLALQTRMQAPSTPPAHRTGMLRAGIVTALVAVALMVGIAQPAETAAYKSTSTVCTTLEAGFNYADDRYTAAYRAGDFKSANYWGNISLGLQGAYLDLNCSYSDYEGAAV